jgi:hypothetical protein
MLINEGMELTLPNGSKLQSESALTLDLRECRSPEMRQDKFYVANFGRFDILIGNDLIQQYEILTRKKTVDFGIMMTPQKAAAGTS